MRGHFQEMYMHEFTRTGTLAILLSCSSGLALGMMPDIPPDETPMAPVRAWTSGPVLGTAAQADSRITQIQKWSITGTNSYASDRTGGEVADQIAYMIHSNPTVLTSGRVAIEVVNVTLGQLKFVPAGSIGNSMRYPSPLNHEWDNLFVDENTDPVYSARTPWKLFGIQEGQDWAEDFAGRLKYYVNTSWIPTPDRFIFDDEPRDFFTNGLALELADGHFQNVLDYWDLLTQDTRWDTEPVPGFNGQTMDDLWDDAVNNKGVVAPAMPGTWVGSYMGGSATNEVWVQWFRNLMRQAEAGVMQEAFYDKIHAEFPNAKCSDYDRSMRIDGSENGNNSWFGGDFAGATGRRWAWDGQGDLQAPCLYPQAGSYFYSSTYCPDPYGLTNDDGNELDWCPFEPVESYSARIHRFVMDSCVRSFGGSYKGGYVSSNFVGTLAPWVPLPGMFYYLSGPNVSLTACSPGAFMAGAVGAGTFNIETCGSIRNTLAMARARGSCEVHFWNDDNHRLSAEGLTGCLASAVSDINSSVQPQKEYPYSQIPALLDQVWGFRYYSKAVPTGTVSAGGSSTPPSLEFAFGDPLQITPATVSGQFKTAVEATFTNSYSPVHGDPAYLRINIEAASTSSATLAVYVRDYTHNEWDLVDIDPSGNTATAGDITGGSPGPTKRVQGVIAGTDHFGSVGEVTVRVETAGATAGGTNYVYYDLIQVVADDGVDFSPADINFDGTVDCADLSTWKYIYYAATHGTPQSKVLSLADFDRDGDVDSSDDDAFETAWSLECEESCDLDICVLP